MTIAQLLMLNYLIMNNVILTTPEELKAIISEIVSNTIPPISSVKELPDSITLDTAVKVLEEF